MKKTCIDCGKAKSLDAFYRLFKGSEHRQSRCKPCDNRKRAGTKRRSVQDTSGHERAGRVDVTREADGSLTMARR